MTESTRALVAMIGAASIWGLSPLIYKQLAHVPPAEVLSHRLIWSLALFVGILAVQGRPRAVLLAFASRRAILTLALSSLIIATNWFVFIWSIQIGRATESALGFYIYPLIAVVIGRFAFSETLSRAQFLAVALVVLGVATLTWGLGAVPWIALSLATTFSLYGLIKKQLDVGPVVSVTVEVLLLSPIAGFVLWQSYHNGTAHFGVDLHDTALLVFAGPLTAVPLILFSYAARRLSMTSIGLLSYLNPTLQFCCAVLVFAEPFTRWHLMAFAMIWTALAIYSVTTLRQDRNRRKSVRAALASGTSAI